VVGSVVSLLPKTDWAMALPPGGIGTALAWMRGHSYIAITLANVGFGSLWYLGAAALAGQRNLSPVRTAQVQQFFAHLDTDITPDELEPPDDARHRGIARMCLIYGAFIALLGLLSPTWSGRLGLAFCALFMIGVGLAIRQSVRSTPPPSRP